MILGGVPIEHANGMAAHSDGDVVLHSLCDALLGAINAGDIGQHFPDNDPAYAGISSRILLRQVYEKVQATGHVIGNVDLTIIAQKPRLANYLPKMREAIAEDLQTRVDRINLKATTTEGMGYTGREEGIAVHCVVLLEDVPG